jgi:hypothetical protein
MSRGCIKSAGGLVVRNVQTGRSHSGSATSSVVTALLPGDSAINSVRVSGVWATASVVRVMGSLLVDEGEGQGRTGPNRVEAGGRIPCSDLPHYLFHCCGDYV